MQIDELIKMNTNSIQIDPSFNLIDSKSLSTLLCEPGTRNNPTTKVSIE
jgi:hypothetical protein